MLHLWRQDGADSGWPLALADAYTRGDDLVATYQPTNVWPYSPQLYWRIDSMAVEEVRSSLSLWISVQTHLLDTWPTVYVGSQLASSEVIRLVPAGNLTIPCLSSDREQWLQPAGDYCCILCRLEDHPWTYVEMMPASDCRQFRVWHSDDGIGYTEWQLFGEFLEKGVIRRARVETLLVPRENDVALATACCAVLSRRPPPLAT